MNKSEIKKSMYLYKGNNFDRIVHFMFSSVERNKFNDSRRKAIYSKVNLSKGQIQEIDDLYVSNYGKRIPYTWHKHYTAFTGHFDVNYFPELLFIPEFERFENLNAEYATAFQDKNLLPLIANNMSVLHKSGRVNVPKIYLSCTAGMYRDSDNRMISKNEAKEILDQLGECFFKPTVDSCSGQGCRVLNISNGTDSISSETVEDILVHGGDNFAIQERITCHESILKIYPDSVNTFRIMTYRWKNDIITCPVIMRIGQGGSNLDNAHAGGMFIALDNDGTMHDTAFTEFKDEFAIHPDTGLIYKDYKISLLPRVLKAAKEMHALIPQLGCINWDFTLDFNGIPVLIEANCFGAGVWLFEMAHGKGVFGDKTPEILRWLRLMKKTKASERKKFAFGEI